MIDHGRLSEIYVRHYLEGDPLVDELYDMVIELIATRDIAVQEAEDMRLDLADIGRLQEEVQDLESDLRDAEDYAHRLQCEIDVLEAGRA